jgi:hypothetical protein
MSDIFKRKILDLKKPITADMVMIEWDGLLAQATNVALQYNQPVNRRWTLGTNGKNTCVIYPGRPLGSFQIQRLFVEGTDDIFDKSGWDPCGNLANIHVLLDGSSALENCTVTGGEYILRGALVTSYGMTAEAEGLSITDNINIEFMQLDYNAQASS